MSNYELVSELLLFNDRDVEWKLNEFQNGSTKVLFVLGFSGSGKTTVGRELAIKYNAVFWGRRNILKDIK